MSLALEPAAQRGGHAVHFYDRDDELVTVLRDYVAEGLGLGEGVVVVATQTHLAALGRALRLAGIDVDAAAGELVTTSASALLDTFMEEGTADPIRFRDRVGAVLDHAAAGARPVRVYGEMVAVLWDAGNVVAALAVEELWNGLARDRSFDLLCGYAATSFADDAEGALLGQVCGHHSQVAREFPVALSSPRAARRFVVETLHSWGRRGVTDAAAVVASELATNAVLHARSAFKVTVSSHDRVLRVAVRDNDPRRPQERRHSADAATGRGLILVDALTVRWGCDVGPSGKVVWSELPADGRA